MITLLPIAALYIFGGATLQDFAFAIMVGIVIGAVGTIFIATPLLDTLMEHEPEYARRKDQDDETAVQDVAASPSRPPRRRPRPSTPMDAIEDAIEVVTGVDIDDDGEILTRDAKREKRRQRRKSRPHGRAR